MPETKKPPLPLKKQRKKKEPLPPLRKNLSALLTLQTFVVLFLVAVVAFSLAMMYRTIITAEHLYGILSMLVPIAIFVSLVNATFSRYMYKYLDDLSKAKEKLAKSFNQNKEKNSYWTGAIENYYTLGVNAPAEYLDTLNSIDAATVQKTLKAIVDQKNVVEVTMLPDLQ